MRRSILSATTLATLMAGAVVAQETDTLEVTRIIGEIAQRHAALSGKTITMTGTLGTYISDNIYFANEDGFFEVQFDAGREARRRIEGCLVTPFGTSSSQCVFEIDAELVVAERFDLADGGEIKLIVYEVR